MNPKNASIAPLVEYSDSGPIKHYPNQNADDISVKFVTPDSVPLAPFYSNTLNGDYEASGIGLVGSGAGTINIPSFPGGSSIVAAFLFWDVIRFNAEVPASPNGTFNGQPITGTLIGSINFFDVYPIDGFYADVSSIAREGGNDLFDFPENSDGSQTDGASLVVIYSNSSLPLKTVVINDGIVVFFGDTVFTNLQNFTAGNYPITAKTTYMVGQVSYGQNEAQFNGAIVGTDVFGASSGAFWNNITVDVSALVGPRDTSAVAGIFLDPYNVLIWVAQAFSVNAPTRGVDISKF